MGFFYSALLASQRVVAFIAEMIHTASLIHDDVIDLAATRRGRPSVQEAWGQRNVSDRCYEGLQPSLLIQSV